MASCGAAGGSVVVVLPFAKFPNFATITTMELRTGFVRKWVGDSLRGHGGEPNTGSSGPAYCRIQVVSNWFITRYCLDLDSVVPTLTIVSGHDSCGVQPHFV